MFRAIRWVDLRLGSAKGTKGLPCSTPFSPSPSGQIRGDDAEAQIEDKQMSRIHFSIEHEGEAHVVRDKGSSNGTFVNGKKIQEQKLDEGDTITAGGTTFTYDYGMSTMLNAAEDQTGGSIQDQLSEMYKNLGNLDDDQ